MGELATSRFKQSVKILAWPEITKKHAEGPGQELYPNNQRGNEISHPLLAQSPLDYAIRQTAPRTTFCLLSIYIMDSTA